jgi:3-phosphoshikimate 1-carboxyvinyltransferase
MKRVTDPLSRMGASFRFLDQDGFLPLRVKGGKLEPLEYRLPVASAQVKSALLLAGLVAGVPVTLWEPGRSRDHTENLLRGLGVPVISGPEGQGWTVSMPAPPESIRPLHLQVPGDFSSAAFFLVLGLLSSSEEPVVLEGVGLNATRSGLLGVLERMGARVEIQNLRGQEQGEPMGDLVVKGCELRGTEVEGPEIPGMIDEVPILAVAAARARGTTVITGARELRVKETDRIHALVQNLRVLGVRTEELEDGLVIHGTADPLEGEVQSFGDHRIAMAFGVLGALPGNRIRVRGEESVGVSFPTFWNRLEELRNR